MPGTRVGALDIQFGANYEQPKLNQLVQSTQQVISAVNSAWNAITALQAAGGSGGGPVTVPVHGLVSNRHTVSGLQAGQVLLATAPTAFGFDFLKLEQLARTDAASIAGATDGEVLTFHDGFWSAEPVATFGLGDPGANALVMWNEAAAAFAWAIPAAGAGISLIPGQIAVNDHELTHGHLLGLLADDHPQYALIGAANTWSFLQTFQAGIVVDAGLTLSGNLEQSGAEPEWFIRNTDDSVDEGAWRMHAEPGMLIFSSVNDDGSDGENWLSTSRIGGLVDAVNISSNSLTWNGAQVLTTDYVPAAPSPIFGQPIFVSQALTLTGIEPFFTFGDTQSAPDEGYWQLHAEPGQLIWSTLTDDGITWGDSWLTVSRSSERVESIALSADSLTWNGDTVLTASSLAAGANVYFSTNAAGQLVVNASAGTGGGLTSPLTTKGDIWGFSTVNARIPVGGTNGFVLTVDSTNALGVSWAASGGGGAVSSVTGTANQVTAAPTTGAVVVALAANVIIPSPPSGDALTVSGVTGQHTVNFQGVAGNPIGLFNGVGSTAGVTFAVSATAIGDIGGGSFAVSGGSAADFALTSRGGQLVLGTNSTARVTVDNAGRVNVASVASAVALTVNGNTATPSTVNLVGGAGIGIAMVLTDNSGTLQQWSVGSGLAIGSGFYEVRDSTRGVTPFYINKTGNVNIQLPASGDAVTINQVTGSEGIRVIATAATPSIVARNNTNGFQIEMGITAAAVYLDASNASNGLALTTQGSANVRVAIGNAGNIVMNAPSSGNTLTLSQVATGASLIAPDTNANVIAEYSNLTFSVGVIFASGAAEISTRNSANLDIGTTAAGTSTTLWASSLNVLTIASTGEVTLGAATSGTVQLNVLAPAGVGPAVTFPDTASYTSFTGALQRFGVGAAFSVGEAEHFTTGTTRLGIGTVGAATLTFYTNSLVAATVSSGQQWNFPATTSGPTISVTGAANVQSMLITGSSTASQSFGLIIKAGTNTSDVSFEVDNSAGSSAYFRVIGDGGLLAGTPTGGDKGPGTLNAGGLFVNGVAVSTGAGLTEFVNSLTAIQGFTSSTTLTAVTGLTLGTIPLGNYQIWITMVVSEITSAAGGFKWDLAGGTLVAANVCWDRDFFVGSGGGAQASTQLYALATADSQATVSTNVAAPSVIFLRGVMRVTTAGTFIVRCAQVASSANTTTLQIGSLVRLTKVA